MTTLSLAAITFTAAVYLSAFVFFGDEFGITGIDFDVQDCGLSCIDDFLGEVGDTVVFLFNLVTLGGISGAIDPLLRAGLLLTMGLMWLLILAGLLRGSSPA